MSIQDKNLSKEELEYFIERLSLPNEHTLDSVTNLPVLPATEQATLQSDIKVRLQRGLQEERTEHGYFGKKPLEEVLNRLNRLFDAVEPILKNYSTEVGGLLEVTKPTQKQKVSTQRVPRRAKRSSESGRVIESEAALRKGIYDFLISISLFHNENRRQAILDYSGLDMQLLAQIQFHGPTDVFVQSLIKVLSNYGTLATGIEAMVAFLDGIKQYVGEDRKHSIDIFVERWKSLRETS